MKDNKGMTGARILWECIEREGVKDVFGYPGGAILPAYDALKHSKIHHVLVRHELGATHMAVPADLQEIVRSVTSGRGVDVAYDLVGRGDTAAAFMEVLAPGGTLCLIGAKRGEALEVPIVEQMILKAARIVGCNYGSAFAARDISRWAAAFQAGRLNLNDIVSSYIALEEINEALSGLDAGHAIRSVITYK